MTYTVGDFRDLVRLLEERPEWRAELRRHVLSDDLLELPAVVRHLAACSPRSRSPSTRTTSSEPAIGPQCSESWGGRSYP